MDIVRFKGGLGNQMFQYAFMQSLKARGRIVKGSLGFYNKHPNLRSFILTEVFRNVNFECVSDELFDEIDNKWKDVKKKASLENYYKNSKEAFFWVERQDGIFDPRVYDTCDCCFVGYWQSYKYFSDISDQIEQCFEFSPTENLMAAAQKLVNYYGIHVRKGDYINDPVLDVCNVSYFQNAYEHIHKMDPNASIIVFTDDEEWARNELMFDFCMIDEIVNIDNKRDWYDMFLMTKCKGLVISNSTFSWWAAWLNKSEFVIVPDRWFTDSTPNGLYCDNWIRVSTI